MEDKEEIPNVPSRVGQYMFHEVLGVGAFAAVFKAEHIDTACRVAVKVVPKRKFSGLEEFSRLQREVRLMRVVDHPFIAACYDILDDMKNFYLVMELAENGSLFDLIRNCGGLHENVAKRIFFQLVLALEYLHKMKKIVHRDLKAENILLDRNNNIRVVDFGLSKTFGDKAPFLLTQCGSPAYVSPEIISDQPYTSAADIWSAGVLLYAMILGSLPFNSDNVSALLQKILNDDVVLPESLSRDARDLLSRMLVKDPRKRISLDDVKMHPWFREFNTLEEADQTGRWMKSFKLIEVDSVDLSIANMVRDLNCDTSRLLTDLKGMALTPATTAYKMLMRERAIDRLMSWKGAVGPIDMKKKKKKVTRDAVPLRKRGQSGGIMRVRTDPKKSQKKGES